MAKPRVLISGAGIAGTVLAYWLGKNDFSVTILERSSSNTESGQIIDIEGPAEQIVTRMGLLDKIKSSATHEAGVQQVDESGRINATIPAGGSAASKEIEIMRPVLADLFIDAVDAFKNVQIRYGSTIQAVEQDSSSVTVDIYDRDTKSTSKETFDFLVAADGLRSKTREFILSPSKSKSCVKSINVFCAFFSIPAEPQDRPYFRVFNVPGRRLASTKPYTEKTTSAYLSYAKTDQRLHDARENRDVQRQKQLLAEHFKGAGWEVDRLIKGMMDTDNFYFEEISQVKLDRWSEGRCVLLGDTAYCPSPLTGQGTNLAILGAYVLASHLVKSPDRPVEAFEAYEKDMRPYVNKNQSIPLGGYLPLLLNPESTWGIWLLRLVFRCAAWLQVWKYLPNISVVPYDLPNL